MSVRVRGFEVGELLYEAPHFEAFRATRQSDGRPVAIKLPRAPLASTASGAADDELRREHTLLGELDGNGVPRPIELIELHPGVVLVEELPAGEPLTGMLAAPLDAAAAQRLGLGLCHALGQLHDRQIIHNNLRPDGIWVEPASGRVVLVDLSSAFHARLRPGERPITLEERDLSRVAPEQTGRTSQPIDHRTDLYGVGLILYEALYGTLPFVSADPMALIHAHLALPTLAPSEHPRDVPDALAQIVLKLLSKSPADRYRGTFGLATDLQRCLASPAPAGALTVSLAHRDPSPRPEPPTSPHGRDEAIAALRAAVERARGDRLELVVLRGDSGMGKTTLVRAGLGGMAGCRWVSGKLDAVTGDTPYGALLHACREIIRQLLGEPDAFVAAWRERLANASPDAGRAIAQVLPEIALLLGRQASPPIHDPAEGQHRLDHAFRALLTTIGRPERPLVVFLDDLQRADPATLSLLQRLFEVASSGHLVFVASWRDEADPLPLHRLLETARARGVAAQEIALGPLAMDDLASLVAAMLDASAEEIRPLAQAIHDKTGGNPQFAVEFIRGLHADAVLRFDSDAGTWSWDLRGVRERAASDNVRDLMQRRLETLSEGARETIATLACLGHEFDEATAIALTARAALLAASDLAQLLAEGMLLDATDESGPRYRFVHDQVQEAAYNLLSEVRRAAIHARIGTILLERAGAEPDDERLYPIVAHLNLGRAAIEEARWIELGRLNLHAGQRAMASAAFEEAEGYLTTALRALPDDAWESQYELAFAANLALAECASLCARTDEAAQRFEVVLGRARSRREKAMVYGAITLSCTYQDRSQRAIDAVIAGLRLLDVRISPNPGVLSLLAVLIVALWRMRRVGAAGLSRLPPMEAPGPRLAMRLLLQAMAPASLLNRRILSAVDALVMLDLSLRHGNTVESAIAYASFAILYAQLFGLKTLGYAMGREALALANSYGDPGIQGKVLVLHGGFLAHLGSPLHESMTLLEQAYQKSLHTGDRLYATFAVGGLIAMMPSGGRPIPEVHAWAERGLDLALRIRRAQGVSSARVVMGWTRALGGLEGPPEDPAERDVHATREDEDWAMLLSSLLEVQVAYLLRRPTEAWAAAQVMRKRPEILRLAECYREYFTFYEAMTAAALVDRGEAPRGWRRVLLRAERYFERVSERCPANGHHRRLLIAAERARLAGREGPAGDFYAQGAEAAATNRFPHEEALAHELAARLHLRSGRLRPAITHVEAARRGYEEWGARAKLAQLDDDLGTLLHASKAAEPRPSEGLRLDLDTVIKASRAISGEIILDELLAKLMRIVIENAGAERGVLVIDRDGTLMIEAEGTASGETTARPPAPVDGDPRLSAAIVHYVARTGESVVLGDAAAEGPFTADPYVAERRPRSVLAAPLFNQGKRMALLYLENNLTADAFTAERLEVVQLLLAQAALSLHNAALYASLKVSNAQLADYSHTLEQKVEERTRELRETQQQLLVKEKLASLGALTSGIAHELKNPLNFIKNFAELSQGLTEELAEELRTPGGDPAVIAETIALLGQNVGTIEKHARRADGIIEGMLLHARNTRSSTRSPVDLNRLVADSIKLARDGVRGGDGGFPIQIDEDYDHTIGLVELAEQEMSRVFVNLVNNAWYAVKQKRNGGGHGFSPTIAVRTVSVGEQVEVHVRDNGTGIPRDVLDRIYHPFFTTKPPGDGAGLGLSISHDIVVAGHRGDMSVESVAGEFTEFVIRLPHAAAAR